MISTEWLIQRKRMPKEIFMSKEMLSLILYPLQSLNLNDEEKVKIKNVLKKEFKNMKNDEFEETLKNKLSVTGMKKIAAEVTDENRLKYFDISRTLVELIEFSKPQLERLSEVGKALKINKEDTGLEFDLYNLDKINDFEFKKSIKKFSIVAAAIGFIPFVPISDFTILSVLHVGMISKIANIYGFKIEPKQFLKMIAGTLGAGIIFKITSKVLCTLLPFVGWIINASVAFAGTYAVGILAKSYIDENGELTKETIRSIWRKSYEEGKEEFWKLKEYIFEKKEELLKEIEKYRKNSSK